jgi:hypothetical protein
LTAAGTGDTDETNPETTPMFEPETFDTDILYRARDELSRRAANAIASSATLPAKAEIVYDKRNALADAYAFQSLRNAIQNTINDRRARDERKPELPNPAARDGDGVCRNIPKGDD